MGTVGATVHYRPTHVTSNPFSAKFDDGTETERTRRVIAID